MWRETVSESVGERKTPQHFMLGVVIVRENHLLIISRATAECKTSALQSCPAFSLALSFTVIWCWLFRSRACTYFSFLNAEGHQTLVHVYSQRQGSKQDWVSAQEAFLGPSGVGLKCEFHRLTYVRACRYGRWMIFWQNGPNGLNFARRSEDPSIPHDLQSRAKLQSKVMVVFVAVAKIF